MSDGACCHYCRRYICICGMLEAMRKTKAEPYQIEALLMWLHGRGMTLEEAHKALEGLRGES